MKKYFLNEQLVMFVILINCLFIFFEGYYDSDDISIFFVANLFFALFYILEGMVKINFHGFKKYIKPAINKLDFFLIFISIIELVSLVFVITANEYTFLFSLRSVRLIRAIRLLKVIGLLKNGEQLLNGIGRALKSSYVIILLFFLTNFILSTISFNLFKPVSPEHFGDPLTALYSIFKIFTVEGWYEIPEEIASKFGFVQSWLVKLYFISILFIGGIFGLSIVNSLFVEGMINNEEDDKRLDDIIERLNRIEKNQNK